MLRAALTGFLVSAGSILLATPVGETFGLCQPDAFGCLPALFWLGAVGGIVAGFVITSWREVLALVAGFWAGGVAYGLLLTVAGTVTDPVGVLVTVPGGAAVFLGFLGVPALAIVALIRWAARRNAAPRIPPEESPEG